MCVLYDSIHVKLKNRQTSRWEQKSEQWLHLAQSCLPLCDPVDCSPPGSSVHGISQARILERVAISFSRGSSQPRDQTSISCKSPALVGGLFTSGATWEPWLHLGKGQRKNEGKISRETVMLGVHCTDGRDAWCSLHQRPFLIAGVSHAFLRDRRKLHSPETRAKHSSPLSGKASPLKVPSCLISKFTWRSDGCSRDSVLRP